MKSLIIVLISESFIPFIAMNDMMMFIPVLDKSGGIKFVIGTSIDITREKMAEEKLKNKLDELEKFHKLVVGRELKMSELKDRIKNLEEKKSP